MRAREKFQQAAQLIDAEQRMKKSMWGQFWSAHQRFFKYLCIASKVCRVVQLAREEVQNGKVCVCVCVLVKSGSIHLKFEVIKACKGHSILNHRSYRRFVLLFWALIIDLLLNFFFFLQCVVIGLQSTGEARTLEALEEGGGELNDFVSTAKYV